MPQTDHLIGIGKNNMFFEALQQYRKPILLTIGTLAILGMGFIGYSIYLQQERQGKIAITVTAVPNDTTITLNGSQKISPGVIYLAPGTYSVRGHKDGFNDFTREFSLDGDHSRITVPLVPSSEEAKKWAQDNHSKYSELEKIGGAIAAKNGEKFHKENPIVNNLPYENPYYTIGYQSADDKTIILTISAVSARYRYNALQQIRSWGYDPTDFKILYTNYVSQLQ